MSCIVCLQIRRDNSFTVVFITDRHISLHTYLITKSNENLLKLRLNVVHLHFINSGILAFGETKILKEKFRL